MTNRLAEQLPNDGQVGDYRFVRHISTDKRPSSDPTNRRREADLIPNESAYLQ
jgi:hypothetical protein